jgi:signal transduction histidine kinase
MEERAQLLDGRIEIHSREGEGTTVQVRIPFEAEK